MSISLAPHQQFKRDGSRYKVRRELSPLPENPSIEMVKDHVNASRVLDATNSFQDHMEKQIEFDRRVDNTWRDKDKELGQVKAKIRNKTNWRSIGDDIATAAGWAGVGGFFMSPIFQGVSPGAAGGAVLLATLGAMGAAVAVGVGFEKALPKIGKLSEVTMSTENDSVTEYTRTPLDPESKARPLTKSTESNGSVWYAEEGVRRLKVSDEVMEMEFNAAKLEPVLLNGDHDPKHDYSNPRTAPIDLGSSGQWSTPTTEEKLHQEMTAVKNDVERVVSHFREQNDSASDFRADGSVLLFNNNFQGTLEQDELGRESLSAFEGKSAVGGKHYRLTSEDGKTIYEAGLKRVEVDTKAGTMTLLEAEVPST